ncbi:hypothetical protein GOP47_0021189 [Adiantum capillus-veneris]|uniref:Uncharacterized protein n=1 Tax=Adiantum capillus-veneris TaxID=13818 RepID=A0A9D4UAM7_ADICA|nr:hypothetical protein GOP47_0021189 [Adiantum capillus-veneris]
MLEVKGEPYDYYSGEFPACVKILKLAPDALEWETLFEKLDVAHRFMEWPCSEAFETHRDVCFASMGKKVIAMGHLPSDCDYEEKGEVELKATESNEVFHLSLNCPANWDAVVVNA